MVGPALSCLEEERGREWDEDKDEDEDGERRDFGEKRKGEVWWVGESKKLFRQLQ